MSDSNKELSKEPNCINRKPSDIPHVMSCASTILSVAGAPAVQMKRLELHLHWKFALGALSTFVTRFSDVFLNLVTGS
jgi:hypothetical protein